jgi:hypothetical protein
MTAMKSYPCAKILSKPSLGLISTPKKIKSNHILLKLCPLISSINLNMVLMFAEIASTELGQFHSSHRRFWHLHPV